MLNLTEKQDILNKIKETIKKEHQIPIEELTKKVFEIHNQPRFSADDYFKGGISASNAIVIAAVISLMIYIYRRNSNAGQPISFTVYSKSDPPNPR